jgi:hypothetical protein
VKHDPRKTVPKNLEGKILPVTRPDFRLRWEMCNLMKEVDPDVNFYSIRPLSHEFMNFIDGERTVEKIAKAVGYEYGVKIKGEHAMLFFAHLEERGLISLHHRE